MIFKLNASSVQVSTGNATDRVAVGFDQCRPVRANEEYVVSLRQVFLFDWWFEQRDSAGEIRMTPDLEAFSWEFRNASGFVFFYWVTWILTYSELMTQAHLLDGGRRRLLQLQGVLCGPIVRRGNEKRHGVSSGEQCPWRRLLKHFFVFQWSQNGFSFFKKWIQLRPCWRCEWWAAFCWPTRPFFRTTCTLPAKKPSLKWVRPRDLALAMALSWRLLPCTHSISRWPMIHSGLARPVTMKKKPTMAGMSFKIGRVPGAEVGQLAPDAGQRAAGAADGGQGRPHPTVAHPHRRGRERHLHRRHVLHRRLPSQLPQLNATSRWKRSSHLNPPSFRISISGRPTLHFVPFSFHSRSLFTSVYPRLPSFFLIFLSCGSVIHFESVCQLILVWCKINGKKNLLRAPIEWFFLGKRKIEI